MKYFREHRESLEASMKTKVPCANLKELATIVREMLGKIVGSPAYLKSIEEFACLLEIKPYCIDNRIGWDTHIVHLPGYGVIGFVDGGL